MRKTLLRCAFILAALSCQDYPFEEVRPVTIIATKVERRVDVTSKADILFVIDSSGSMGGEQQNLATNFSAFINALNAFDPPVDYQIGVVDTSVWKTVHEGSGCPATACACAPGTFVCESGNCIQRYATRGKLLSQNGRPTILKRPVVGGVAQAPVPTDILAAFADNVKVGTTGSFVEFGFEAMRLAIQKSVPGGDNADFLRDGSKLVVVIVSDEEECSAPEGYAQYNFTAICGFADNCPAEAQLPGGGQLTDVADYVAFLRGLKNADASQRKVEVGIVADIANLDTAQAARCTNSQCVTDCGSDAICRGNCSAQGPGSRYVAFANAMTGVKASICDASFSTTLENLAKIVGLSQEIRLDAEVTNPDLLVVKVTKPDGAVVSCVRDTDFAYLCDPTKCPSTEAPVLRFQGACTLQPDFSYDIRYLTGG